MGESLRDLLGEHDHEVLMGGLKEDREKNYFKISGFISNRIKETYEKKPQLKDGISKRVKRFWFDNPKLKEKVITNMRTAKVRHDVLVDYFFNNPNEIEHGFRVIAKNFDIGKVFDIIGRDGGGTLTIVEVKIDMRNSNRGRGRWQLFKYGRYLRSLAKLLGIEDLPIKLILIRETASGIKKDVWEV